MKWGSEVEILESLRAEGREFPPSLQGYLERPHLSENLVWIWDAFLALSTDRQVGMGEGPIPFSSIDRYARRYGIDGLDEFDEFVSVISALDREYLQAMERKREAAAKPAQDDN